MSSIPLSGIPGDLLLFLASYAPRKPSCTHHWIGRGIGRAIARLFAKEGAAIFLTARTEKELAATAAEIAKGGGRAAFATADVALEKDCNRVVGAAREKFGKIDILVNNAGHYGPVVPV